MEDQINQTDIEFGKSLAPNPATPAEMPTQHFHSDIITSEEDIGPVAKDSAVEAKNAAVGMTKKVIATVKARPFLVVAGFAAAATVLTAGAALLLASGKKVKASARDEEIPKKRKSAAAKKASIKPSERHV